MDDRVFICYSRKDEEFVLNLAKNLKDKGVPIWIDQWDIPMGANWDRTIEEVLKKCTHLLVILSPNSVKSDDVHSEWFFALEAGKVVLPILYQPCDIPFRLNTVQYIDFTSRGPDNEEAIEKIVNALEMARSIPIEPIAQLEQPPETHARNTSVYTKSESQTTVDKSSADTNKKIAAGLSIALVVLLAILFKVYPTPLTISDGQSISQKAYLPLNSKEIYAIKDNGKLYWYKYLDIENGSWKWAEGSGKVIASGWNFKQVFAGGKGVIYAIAGDGTLYWFRHDGWQDGSPTWTNNGTNGTPKVVGNGWNFKNVFPGSVQGVIYAIADDGTLYWFRHDGWQDGSPKWAWKWAADDGSSKSAADGGKVIGHGWNFKQVFAGGKNAIYAITDDRKLYWFRHDGWQDGSPTWTYDDNLIGIDWNFKQVFADVEGTIYATTDNGKLLWYKHLDIENGSWKWAEGSGGVIGIDWNFKQVFTR